MSELLTLEDNVLDTLTWASFLHIDLEVNQWPQNAEACQLIFNCKTIINQISIQDFITDVNSTLFFRSGYEIFCKLFDVPVVENFDSDFFTGYDELIHLLPYYYAITHGDDSLKVVTQEWMLSYVREHNTWWNLGYLFTSQEINPLKEKITIEEWNTIWCSLVVEPHYRQCALEMLWVDDPILFNEYLQERCHEDMYDMDVTLTPAEVQERLNSLLPQIPLAPEINVHF